MSTRTVAGPAPIVRFGPSPLIRIRCDDVTPVARLTATAEAFERGYELVPIEPDAIDEL